MKRNTLAKKLMAALLTGTMIMSMGMTSFATTGVHDGGTSGVTGVTLTKKITGADNEYTPNVDFTFNVSNDLSEVELGYQPAAETENKDIPRLKGVMSAITSSLNVKFEAETGSPSNAAKTRTGTISFNASEYKAPGIYRYKITEDARIDYAGITSDPTTYYMDVYVTDKSGEGAFSPLISYVVVFKANGDTFSKSDLVFENKYETNKLTLTKEVAGNQGNRTDKFNFTIVIKGEPGDKFVTSKGTFEYKETGTATLKIELGHDETVTISGLSADDTYEITEDNYASDGYKTTISGADSSSGLVAKGDVSNGDDNVTYINTKSVTTPTGIAMTFAPYAVMVAFAGVFAVMFLRKKREDF